MTRICPICGKEFVIRSSNHKMCSPECKKEQRNRANKLRGVSSDNKPLCYTRTNHDLSKMAAEARAAGMSYGQYVGLKGI